MPSQGIPKFRAVVLQAASRQLLSVLYGIGRGLRRVSPDLPKRILPPASQRRSRFDRLVRRAATSLRAPPRPPFAHHERPTPVLRPSEPPAVSIIVASWNNVDFTLRCLASIALDESATPYEVIVVDDASTDPDVVPTLESVEGIRLITLTANLGYVRANNHAAALARGDLLVLLNNDVQVTAGWLDALVERLSSDTEIGLVGARLVYPDGRLQEAGGIIWRDGSGWNYGHGQPPEDAEYRFTREVDYCSAACVIVRRPVGPLFDERYAPAYFEDVDLCFRLRERGQRTVYEPRAVVIHDEGVSHGRDIESGLKAFQQHHRQVFVERWSNDLRRQHPADATLVPQARDRRRGAHVLLVDEKVPTPDVDSGSVRSLALITAFGRLGHMPHFTPTDLASDARYVEPLESAGVEVLEGPHAFRRFLRSLGDRVELCIVSRPLVAASTMQRLRRALPSAVIAYDMVDFHALRVRRLSELGVRDVVGAGAGRVTRLERRCMARADAIIAVTEEEQRLAQAMEPGKPVFLLPNAHEIGGPPHPPTKDRTDVLFVGSFRHSPNVDAAAVLVDDIAPLLAERLPRKTIRVVGIEPPQALVERAPTNVVFEGWVPDLTDAYRTARVVIAPLRAGAGMKGKVGEALTMGVPVVTTAIGAEGYGADAGTFLALADSVEEMVDAIELLYRDDETWRLRAERGWRFVSENLSTEALTRRVEEMLKTLQIGADQL